MIKIAFFDTKAYDKVWFNKLNTDYEIVYHESKLNPKTAALAAGCEAVCAFVNDDINAATIDKLHSLGVKVLVMRCAGYNNVDFKSAYGRLTVLRVPAYSPYAVAEHALALLLTLNRKLHKAYTRTRDFNFSLDGLVGIDLHGKTAGVIGTGKIGKVFAGICKGMGMRVVAYDLFPDETSGLKYLPLDELLSISDIISLHCPLTEQTYHILDAAAFDKMKRGGIIINTSRGMLIESGALLNALNSGKLRGAGLDVYEEESEFFYEDFSTKIVRDDTLSLLLSRPNVIITSHQAFLTEEALENIAAVTLKNVRDYFSGGALENEVCYACGQTPPPLGVCDKVKNGRCF